MPTKHVCIIFSLTVILACFPLSRTVMGLENKPAFVLFNSGSSYRYYAKDASCPGGATDKRITYRQESGLAYRFDLVNIQTPGLGIYFKQGIDYKVLSQSSQQICDSLNTELPGDAVIVFTETYGTVGKQFGFISAELSLGYIESRGAYYHNNLLHAEKSSFLLIRLNSEAHFNLGNRAQFGLRVSHTANAPSFSEEEVQQQGYLEYTEGSIFFRIFL